MNPRLNFMLEIIQKLGEFQHTHFRTDITFETKTWDMDLVSFVDRECEEMFREALKEYFPEDTIMGEESYNTEIDYRKYDKLWIIDPLDGTLMYKRWIPHYGPMIAYVENGKIQMSAIFLPEFYELYYADTTWSYKNNQRIFVSKTSELKQSLIQASSQSLKRKLDMQNFYNYFNNVWSNIDFYSAASLGAYCGSGNIDGGIFIPSKWNIWDTIPSCFLVQQAGGKVTNVWSDTWDIFNRNVILSNGLIHAEFQKLLEN